MTAGKRRYDQPSIPGPNPWEAASDGIITARYCETHALTLTNAHTLTHTHTHTHIHTHTRAIAHTKRSAHAHTHTHKQPRTKSDAHSLTHIFAHKSGVARLSKLSNTNRSLSLLELSSLPNNHHPVTFLQNGLEGPRHRRATPQ